MKIGSVRTLILVVAVIAYGAMFASTAFAQATPEDQAKAILQLFEAGQKDTAYALLEPLKRTARFVPAVIYTRAQMTPDDRALGLYKELMAMEPDGPWAAKAAYQLVVRYVDKRDSLAAHVWTGVLRRYYAASGSVAQAEALLAGVKSWRSADEPGAETPKGSGPKDPKPSAARDSVAKRPAGRTDAGETYSASGMRGFALQVGIYPTKAKAEARAAELKAKNVRALPLPKYIDGRKLYALVVGPYTTIDEANKSKATVVKACDCQAFIVNVR